MRTAAAKCALLAVTLIAAPAQAQDAAPLSASPASVTLNASGAGSVRLVNQSGIELEVDTFVAGEDGDRLPGATATVPEGGRLGPGETAPVKLAVRSPPASATIVAFVAPAPGLPRGAVLRIPVRRGVAVKPSVDAWTLVNVHAGDDRGRDLPLTGACSGLALKQGATLGTLQAGGASLAVTGSCASPDATSLRLGTVAIDTDGRDYKGSIKLGDDKVALTVEDTLTGSLVALLVAFGIGIALVVTSWQGGGRAAARAVRSSYEVEQLLSDRNPSSADKSFAAAARELGLPTLVQAWTIADGIRARLAELRATLRRVPDAEAVEAAQTELDALALEVRSWPDTANTLAQLKKRMSNLDSLPTYLDKVLAATLQRPGPLDRDTMREVKSTASEAALLAADWPAAAIERAREMAADLPAGEREALDTVLERFHLAATAGAARELLDDFWKAYEAVRVAHARIPDMKSFMPKAGGVGWTGVFEGVVADDPAATARGLAAQIWAIDLWVLAVLLLAALVGAMEVLWVGKSFGGFWDIASALVWGLGAGALGAPLSAALGDLGRSWLDARNAA